MDIRIKNISQHSFHRCGMAALSDLQSDDCQKIFSVLEKHQSRFLSKATDFRSEELP